MPTPNERDEIQRRINELTSPSNPFTDIDDGPEPEPATPRARSPRFTYAASPNASVFLDTAISETYYGRRQPLASCVGCSLAITDENAQTFEWREDNLWCEGCVRRNFVPCAGCTELTYSGNARQVRTRTGPNPTEYLCPQCFSNLDIRGCTGCGNHFYPDDPNWVTGRSQRCRSCSRRYEESGAIELRNFGRPSDLVENAEHGKIIKSTRPIGVELETQFTNGKKAFKASLELRESVGIGTDSSIQGGNGLEIRLPPASGNKAEKLISHTCETLVSHGFKVNPTCGMHIHFDVSDMDDLTPNDQLRMIKHLWTFYLMFEDVIVSFLPPSRRTKNRYCQPIRSDYSAKEVLSCRSMDQIERLWYRVTNVQLVSAAKAEHHHASRYRGINLHPLFSARHMEVRYHTGTLNTKKILEWANLHARIIDCAVNNAWQIDENVARDVINEISLHKKTDLMFRYLRIGEDSQGYFIARQQSFADSFKLDTSRTSFKQGMAELEVEKEQ